jgi:purine-binding chemotaxis protein CheW
MERVLEKDAASRAEFLTFTLGTEQYGIDILRVREIRRYEGVTAIPSLPAFVKGVIDLRGTIVPVVDLRTRLKLERADFNSLTVLIIVDVGGRTVGMVVDGVSDVLAFDPKDVKPVPDLGASIDCKFITGLAGGAGGMVILLDLVPFMSSAALDLDPRVKH